MHPAPLPHGSVRTHFNLCIFLFLLFFRKKSTTPAKARNKEEVIAIILGGRRRILILCCYSFKYLFGLSISCVLSRLVSLNIKNTLFTIKFLLLYLQNPYTMPILCTCMIYPWILFWLWPILGLVDTFILLQYMY